MLHIIWDLDGTLINSQQEIINTVTLALRDVGLNISDMIIPMRIGPPLDVMLRRSFSAHLLTDAKLAEVILSFRRRYDNSDFTMTVPFDGIEDIVSDQRHFFHHIVTNKPYSATKRIVEKFGWSDKFTTLLTPDAQLDNAIEKNKVYSKTDLFANIIANHSSNDYLFAGIGDMKSDCIAAKENNIRSLGVLWGTGTKEELSDCCDYVFDDAKQLYEFLYKIV
jgi:phosphoglycolate phosphatase